MPENEFEKEVQQKMDGFKLNPSNEVWNKVFAEIAPHKKRKKRIALYFIVLCFLLVGSWFLPLLNTHYFLEKPMSDLSSVPRNINEPTEKEIVPFKKSKGIKSKFKLRDVAVNKPVIDDDKNIQSAQQISTFKRSNSILSVTSAIKKIRKSEGGKLLKKVQDIFEETVNILPVTNKKLPQIYPEENKTLPLSKIKIDINSHILFKAVIVPNTPDTIKNNNTGIVKNISKTKNNKKWILGINVALGKSATGNGYLASNNNRNFDYLLSPVSSVGSSINNGVAPASINSGIALTVGILANHQLSSKSNIAIGLNYKLLTTNLLIGKDSSNNNAIIYSVGNTKTYYNNYHLIELPITFQRQVFSIKRHAVLVDAGISIAQLLYTNSLQYNNFQSNYYMDNKIFNKTMIALIGGVFINIAGNKSAQFLIGPQFYYSSTTIATSGLYTKAHYSFAGIKLQKMLRKK